MRIALFGGTFDPIHNAHLAVAREAADGFRLDRVLFIPAAHPPHKQHGAHASYEDRVRMAELATAGDPRFCVSRLEQGAGRSYSIDTIERVRATLAPDDSLFFIIGADAFAEIQTWRRWREVAEAVRFIVVSRPNSKYDPPTEVRFERLDTLSLPVSSSDVRAALAQGRRPRELPAPVQRYIEDRALYGNAIQPPMNAD
jgi:nicotinate-nucleotide adenylyltransferase